jgi:hypothetical protein
MYTILRYVELTADDVQRWQAPVVSKVDNRKRRFVPELGATPNNHERHSQPESRSH